ncbi:MAG: T9SS type A sorting domain-containing protein [Flavobacteriales bacterium]|nr:T9SS type A sorting domain-containing protein [Flavobacteriales bacterium]
MHLRRRAQLHPGAPCNDFNACTTGEVFDANCNCGGGTAVDPNDNNPCTLDSCDPVTGVSNVFQDADGDGTCDANDLCPGGPEPGTACNDNDPCTVNDVIGTNCNCAGTFQDSDSDGVCDANDQCPGGPEPGTTCDDGNGATTGDVIQLNCTCAGVLSCTPGAPCNDFNACTTGEVFDANCNCGGGTAVDPNDNNPCTLDSCDPVTGVSNVFQDADGDGTCDANDLCPGGPEPGTACNDDDPCTVNDVIGTNCNCAGTFQDSDSDGVCDASDNCPTVPGQIGSACDDGNIGTESDVLNANCVCQGTPVGGCDYPVNLVIETDANGGETTWEIVLQGTETAVCSGGPFAGVNNAFIGEQCCLNTGCYELRVFDSAGDGMSTGGYVLSLLTGGRLIDNRDNGTGFTDVSTIANGDGFCLPIGSSTLSVTSCDREWWTSGELISVNPEAAVTAVWNAYPAGSPERSNTGYQMWWFNPNGGYSFRRYQSHNTPNSLPASSIRASRFVVNGWIGNQLEEGVLYNVRARSRVLGTYAEFGPTCRFRLDEQLAECPPTQLVNIPGHPEYSCGVTRQAPSNQKIWAFARAGADIYQFRFSVPSEGIVFNRNSPTHWMALSGPGAGAFQNGTTYEVQVRISKDDGATWCPFGEVCQVTIDNGGGELMLDGASSAGHEAAVESRMTVWPNPNRGELLNMSITGFTQHDAVFTFDLYDMLGNRVVTSTCAAQDGTLNGSLELPASLSTGMYVLHVTGAGSVWTERVVMQR